MRVVFEGESNIPGRRVYWVGLDGEKEPFGQIIATPEVADFIYRTANQEPVTRGEQKLDQSS